MAFTYVLQYPDGQERTIASEVNLTPSDVIEVRPPLDEASALAEAERLYATGKAPTTAGLVRYRVTGKSLEPRELEYGKLQTITVVTLEVPTDA